MSKNNNNQRPIDKLTGFQVLDAFRKFNQRDDIFCRSQWDPTVKSDKAVAFFSGYFMPNARSRKTDGFSQRDYALRNAAWHVTNIFRDINRHDTGRKEGFFDHFTTHDEGGAEPYPFENDAQATHDIRKAAELFEADLFGVCEFDERWMYSGIYNESSDDSKPIDLPEELPFIIVIGESMDLGLTATVPSALSGSATGLGYSYDSVTLITLAQYIRNLGYRAYASMNDSSLGIPLAVQAGFGEVGRHSLLITEEYGPRLRLGRIFTDLPLVVSRPKTFGVKEFCSMCDRCAAACPPKAIPVGPHSNKIHNRSNLIGVKKWTVDAEKCFKFWVNQNTDCSICIRVCPYNRDYSRWYNRLWKKLAGSPLRRIALWLDDLFSNRIRRKSNSWWNEA
mgnify:FL=1